MLPGTPSAQSSEIDAMLGASTLAAPSSVALGWHGLAVERRVIHPGDKDEQPIDDHFLILWDAPGAEGESAGARGKFARYRKLPNTITTCLPGFRPAIRSKAAQKVVVCRISPRILHDVEMELERRPIGPIHPLYGSSDAVLRELMCCLAHEAEGGGPGGTLRAEALSVELVTRFLFTARSLKQPGGDGLSPVSRRVLRRVLERMEEELGETLTLQTLARESGYSRSHFLRVFHAATGLSPHRYLLELRLKRAQSMVLHRPLSLLDIATACGFSSHAHLSTAFRSRFGVTPSAYRRLTMR